MATPDKKNIKSAYRTSYLIFGYIQQTLTPEEQIELDDWISASRDNLKLFEELTDRKTIEKMIKEANLRFNDKGQD